MSEPKRYPCNTMAEMAAIPAEALPRFLAELPELLGEVRQMLALADHLPEGVELSCEGATWIDDTERTATMVLTPEGIPGVEGELRVTRKFGDDTDETGSVH